MTDLAFLYDNDKKFWHETETEKYHTLDIEKANKVIVLDYSSIMERRCLVVWCEKHSRFEEVKEQNSENVLTVNGCTMNGLVLQAVGKSCNVIDRIDVRWRIIQRKQGMLSFSVDKIILEYLPGKWIRFEDKRLYMPRIKYDVIGYQLNLEKGEVRPFADNQARTDLPLKIFNEIMRLLVEDAAEIFGMRPIIKCSAGKAFDRLLCFMSRPLDMNAAFNYFYISEKMDELLPRTNTQEQNFIALCNIFNVEKSERLFKAYEKDPFAVHKLWALNFIGFKSFEVIRLLSEQRKIWNVEYSYEYRIPNNGRWFGWNDDVPEFFRNRTSSLNKEASESILVAEKSTPPPQVQAETANIRDHSATISQEERDMLLNGKIVWRDSRSGLAANDRYRLRRHTFIAENPYPEDDIRHHFVAVNFAYCRDMKALYLLYSKLKSEADLAALLINHLKDGYTEWQEDFFRLIREYGPYITGRGYVQMFNEGLTLDAYEAMARDIVDNTIQRSLELHPLNLPEGAEEREENVGGYDFRLLRYEEDYSDMSYHVNFRLTDFQVNAVNEQTACYLIEKDMKYYGLVEVRKGRISTTLGQDDVYLSDELVKVCAYWGKHHGLDIRTGKLVIAGEQNYTEEYNISEVKSLTPLAERYSLKYLLQLKKENIYKGYYHDLGIALEIYGNRFPRFCAERKWFANEFQYFKHRAPAAVRIYDGAVSGIPDAQDELGMLYEEGRMVDQDVDMAIEWYEKAALQGYRPAMSNVAYCYRLFRDDDEKAVYWYEKAAELGDKNAAWWIEIYEEKKKNVRKNSAHR